MEQRSAVCVVKQTSSDVQSTEAGGPGVPRLSAGFVFWESDQFLDSLAALKLVSTGSNVAQSGSSTDPLGWNQPREVLCVQVPATSEFNHDRAAMTRARTNKKHFLGKQKALLTLGVPDQGGTGSARPFPRRKAGFSGRWVIRNLLHPGRPGTHGSDGPIAVSCAGRPPRRCNL